MDEFSWDTVPEIWQFFRKEIRVLREPRIERKELSMIRLQFYPFVETVISFFFLFLKDYNNWWLLMRYLSSFALSRGREPKSIPPFYSSTRQISRLTNSLYKYTFFIPPFPWRIHSVYYCTLKLHARTISVSNVVLFLSDCRGGSVLLYLVRRLYFVEVSKAFLVNRYFIREN